MLEQCVELFRQLDQQSLSQLLLHALEQEPLAMPADHQGHPATQMYRLQLDHEQRRAALQAVKCAVDKRLTTPATARRGLGGFIEAWSEYASSVQ